MKTEYTINVGNIGNVHIGNNKRKALLEFRSWQHMASDKPFFGRAGGESVTLFANDEILREHIGENDNTREEE